jgi:Serpin (serine protease inhibitor)
MLQVVKTVAKSMTNNELCYRLYTANGMSIKTKFLDLLDKSFLTTIENVDFSKSAETAEQINEGTIVKNFFIVFDALTNKLVCLYAVNINFPIRQKRLHE